MATPTKEDHVVIGGGQLPDFFQKRPIASGLLKAFLRPYNELENVLFQMLMFRGIYEAQGLQLDIIGDLFGVDRQNRLDEEYRGVILRRIAIQRSDGTTEQFLQGLRTITGSTYVDFFEHYSAHATVWLGDGYGQGVQQAIRDIAPAGVSLEIIFDNRFDSFVPEEEDSIVSDLQSHLEEDYQVIDNFGILRDLQVQTNITELEATANSIYAEEVDILSTTPEESFDIYYPFAEILEGDLLFTATELLANDNPNLIALYEFNGTGTTLKDTSSSGLRDILDFTGWIRENSAHNPTTALAPIAPYDGTFEIPNTASLLGADPTKPFTINALLSFKDVLFNSSNPAFTLFSTFNITELGGWALHCSPEPSVNPETGRVNYILFLDIFSDQGTQETSSIYVVDSDTPLQLSVVYDGVGIYVFLNGFRAINFLPPFRPASGLTSIAPSTTKNLTVGRDSDYATFNNAFAANVQIENLRIYDRALEQAELLTISPYRDPLLSLE